MNIGELAKFRGGASVDTISELTSASGVTVDGTLLKDGGVTASGTVSVNTITEFASGSGVTIDETLLKDGGVTLKTGSEISDAGGKYVKIKGGDGTDVAAGYVGYAYVNSSKNTGTLTSGQYFDALSAPFNLPVGVYEIQSTISVGTTGSPTTIRSANIGIGTASGNDSTGYPGAAYTGDLITANYSAGVRASCSHRLIVTNASQNYYLKGFYSATGTPGTATVDTAIVRAIRIA
jgi:hypothetical protein